MNWAVASLPTISSASKSPIRLLPVPNSRWSLPPARHAGETGGSYALDGLVRYLLSDDPLAVNLRTKAELYVYPQVNPDGRFAGYYRSSVENPEKDFNRFYDNPDGFTDLTIITDAMRQDTGGDADYVIDFHSWFGPWINDNYVLTTAELANSPLLQNLAVWEPNLDVAISNGQPGMLRVWSMTAEGLNAEFTYTPELGFHPGVTTDRLRLYGENFARALADVAGAPADCDLNVDGFCDVIDADLLTELGDLVQGVESPHPRFDLDADGDADVDDLELWLAVAAIQNGFAQPYFLGDANLDSVVDGQDFIAWNANKFTAGTRWSLGDFDGDGVVDGSDFLDWNRNKFSMITAMVPEPSMCLVWLGVVTIGLWRRETLTRTTIHSLKSAQAERWRRRKCGDGPSAGLNSTTRGVRAVSALLGEPVTGLRKRLVDLVVGQDFNRSVE